MSGDAPTPVLDRDALQRLHRLGGESLVLRMIDLFRQNVPVRVHAATTAAGAQDWKGVEHAAHSLKSTAANVGAARLRATAESLERAAAEHEVHTILRLIHDLDRDARDAERVLQDERKEGAS